MSRDQARVVVEKSGIPVAGLVSLEDLVWLKQRDNRLAELRQVMDQIRVAFMDIPEDEFNKEVERSLSDVRAEPVEPGNEGEA